MHAPRLRVNRVNCEKAVHLHELNGTWTRLSNAPPPFSNPSIDSTHASPWNSYTDSFRGENDLCLSRVVAPGVVSSESTIGRVQLIFLGGGGIPVRRNGFPPRWKFMEVNLRIEG